MTKNHSTNIGFYLRLAILFLLGFTFILGMALGGCKKDDPKKQTPIMRYTDYGAGIKDTVNLTSIANIVRNPGEFDNKNVTVKGIIASVCPSAGCFFSLGEGASNIDIDLKQNGFNIPPGKNIGHIAFAHGKVSVSGESVMIIGKSVRIVEK